MATAPNTTIATSSGFERTCPSQAKLADGVLQGRRIVTEDPTIDDAEQFLDSGISREPLAGARAVKSTYALDAKFTELGWSSSDLWDELLALHQLVFSAGLHFDTWAAGPTSFVDESRDTRQRSSVRSFSELADELTADVPDSEWDRVPTDLARNLDHYLYGAPKEDE